MNTPFRAQPRFQLVAVAKANANQPEMTARVSFPFQCATDPNALLSRQVRAT